MEVKNGENHSITFFTTEKLIICHIWHSVSPLIRLPDVVIGLHFILVICFFLLCRMGC